MILHSIQVTEFDYYDSIILEGDPPADLEDIFGRFDTNLTIASKLPPGRYTADDVTSFMRKIIENPDDDTYEVVYWLGHGDNEAARGFLCLSSTVRRQLAEGISSDVLYSYLSKIATARPIILILEACESNRIAKRLQRMFEDECPDGQLLIFHATAKVTVPGAAVSAIDRAMRIAFGNSDEVPLWQLAGQVEDDGLATGIGAKHTGLRGLRLQSHWRPPSGNTVEMNFELTELFKNLPPDMKTHFVPKARSGGLGEIAWFFTGREDERASILDWLEFGPEPIFVVTGQPGQGKSALLGDIVVRSYPKLLELLVNAKLVSNNGHAKPIVHETIAINCSGLNTGELTRRLAAEISGRDFTDGNAPMPLVDDVQTVLGEFADRARFVVLDGLDEMDDAFEGARFVAHLSESAGIKILVGTRSTAAHTQSYPYLHGDLLRILGVGQTARSVTLERDVDGMVEYAGRRLSKRFDDEATSVALRVGNAAADYLHASVLIHELSHELNSTSDHDLAEFLIDLTLEELFSWMLDRLAGLSPAYPALLRTCALAQGRGVPLQSSVWSDLAKAVHPGLSIEHYAASSVVELAAPYLRMDQEAGQTVFRPAHALLRDFLLRDVGDVQGAHEVMAKHCAAQASKGHIREPYYLRHATSHARGAGISGWFAVDRVARRVWDHLAPDRVVQDAMESLFGVSKMPVGVSDVISTFHPMSQSRHHAAIRQWADASRTGRFLLEPRETPNSDDGSETLVLWARGLTTTPPNLGLRTPGRARPVTALCHVDLGPGQGGLLAGTRDGEVALWDPRRSVQLRRHRVPGGSRIVTAVCGVVVADDDYELGMGLELVVGTSDGRVVAWRSLDGSMVWQRDLHRGRVTCLVSFKGPDGEPLIACLARGHLFVLGSDLHVRATYSWNASLSPCIAVGDLTPDHKVPIAVASEDGVVRVAWLRIEDTRYQLSAETELISVGFTVLDLVFTSVSPITIRAVSSDGVTGTLRLGSDPDFSSASPGSTDFNWQRAVLGPSGGSYLAGSDGHVQFTGTSHPPRVAPVVRSRHGGSQASISLFYPVPHAELVATGGRDGIVRVWDTGFSQWQAGDQQDAAEVVHLCGVNGAGQGLVIKADRQGGVSFVNFGDARKLGIVEHGADAPQERVVSIASSIDRLGQSLIAIATQSTVSLWRENKVIQPCKAWPDLMVGDVYAVSVDGHHGHEHVVVAHGGGLTLWTDSEGGHQNVRLPFQNIRISAIKAVRHRNFITRVVVLAGREVLAYEFARGHPPFEVGSVRLREDPSCAAFYRLSDGNVGLFYGTTTAELRVVPSLLKGRQLSSDSDMVHLNAGEALICVDAAVGDDGEVTCIAGGIHGSLLRTDLSSRRRATRLQLGQSVAHTSAAKNGRCIVAVADGFAAFQLGRAEPKT